MPAREFLWVVKESALGTVMTTPTAGTDSMYIRLADGNSFGIAAEPVIEEIPYGGGFAVTAESISDHYQLKGQLKTKLYPTQAPLLLALLLSRINSSQTEPWATTEPAGDLASASFYHAIRRSDGTYLRKRYAGVKAAGGRIEVSRQSTTAMLTLDLVGSRCHGYAADSTTDPDDTEFPAPAETDYPTGPYTFNMTAGLLTIGGAVRTQYDSLTIAIANALDGKWFEAQYLTLNEFCGRASTLDADLLLKATPDDRSALEAITATACSVGFDPGGTSEVLTIDFQGNNYISKLPYDLPLDKTFMQKLSLKNKFDVAAEKDIEIGFA